MDEINLKGGTMAANCEELKIIVSGYDCMSLMQAIQVWVTFVKVTPETKVELKKLYNSIEHQYNTTERLEIKSCKNS
jgi:hypothetical protein